MTPDEFEAMRNRENEDAFNRSRPAARLHAMRIAHEAYVRGRSDTLKELAALKEGGAT